MSLVGSLEDLGLGDILQIISLSGKSGVLLLRADRGEGQVMFEDGLLRAAFAKGGAANLWELLARAESIPKSDLDAAWREARDVGRPLAELLQDRELLDADTVDQVRRDNIESSVFEMFTWQTGEFSFEVRRLSASDGDDLFVDPGMNPQFLALEGTRIADERRHEAGLSAGAAPLADDDLEDEPMFAEWVPDDEAPEAEPVLTAEPIVEEEVPAAQAPLSEPVVEEPSVHAAEAVEEAAPAAAPKPATRALPPVIVVDPSLPVLEWAKEALADSFPAVHVFQHSDLGIHRIRQYLARAEVPLVILAADAPEDPISGARDPFEIIARLKRQSSRMPVLLLCPPDASPPRRREGRPDGLVVKPSPTELADQREFEARQAHAERLRTHALATFGVAEAPAAEGPDNAASLARLREVTERIHAPGARGEVLPEVLRFASQVFSRVALFMVRDDAAIGIAQSGLQKAGGPDEVGLRSVHIGSREPEWFRAVLESGGSVTAAPQGDGDQRLGVMLGNDLPEQAYVAPIHAGGQIVALLYGDMLPAQRPVGPTDGLERVLETAGIALDRAVRRRTLEGGEPSGPADGA